MKIYKLLVILFAAVMLASCEKDDSKKIDDGSNLRLVSRQQRTMQGTKYYGYTYAYSDAADTTYVTYAGKTSGKIILIKGVSEDVLNYYSYSSDGYILYQTEETKYSDATKTRIISFDSKYDYSGKKESYHIDYTYDGINVTEDKIEYELNRKTRVVNTYSDKQLIKEGYHFFNGKWDLESKETIFYEDKEYRRPTLSMVKNQSGKTVKSTKWTYSGYEYTEINYSYDTPTTKIESELLHSDKTSYVTHYCYYGPDETWMSRYDEYSTYELIE
ncbi:MAG: hypothetical protein MJZ16_00970 [Bacteroidales bacterium]|nr:hypothetical protein [Bacteroidales bacterium]